jgi:EAL domain-containing protein (putative c-di-GMP-specific phosphodiesterase class I)
MTRSSTVPDAVRAAGSDAAAVERLLRERDVHPVFQPIVELTSGAVVGVEALARGPAGSDLHSPAQLFAAATRAGLLSEIDQLCATRALEAARAAAATPGLVFVNAEPAVLDRPLTPELIAVINSGLTFRIVLEFTERALTGQPARLLQITDVTRSWGNLIALDDVGVEPASLAFMPLITPDVIKLDMSLLRSPDRPDTVDTAAAVADHAHRTGAVIIAEGIETEADRATAAALGAHWGQGWLLGRPGPLDALPPAPFAAVQVGSGSVPAPPFTVTHVGTTDTVEDLWGALLRRVARWHTPATVLCAGRDTATVTRWAAALGAMEHVAFRGAVGDLTTAVPGVRVCRPDVLTTEDGTVTAVAVTAHSAVVLRAVPRPDGRSDITFTDDLALGAHLARTMLNHFG